MPTLNYHHPKGATPRQRKNRHLLPPGIGPGLKSLFAGLVPTLGFFILALLALLLPRNTRYGMGMVLLPLLPFIGGLFVICAMVMHGVIAVQLHRELDERRAIRFDRCVAWLMWFTGLLVLFASVWIAIMQ